MNNKSLNHQVAKWAKRAPRKKAGVVGFAFLLELLALVPIIIIAMPMLIMLYCYSADGYGQMVGDATTLPAWFNSMLLQVAIITILVVFALQLLIVMIVNKAWRETKKQLKVA